MANPYLNLDLGDAPPDPSVPTTPDPVAPIEPVDPLAPKNPYADLDTPGVEEDPEPAADFGGVGPLIEPPLMGQGALTAEADEERRNADVGYMFDMASRKDGNKWAGIHGLHQATGIPHDEVEKNYEELRRTFEASNRDPEKWRRDNPGMYEWIEKDRNRVSMMGNESMSKFGRWARFAGSRIDTILARWNFEKSLEGGLSVYETAPGVTDAMKGMEEAKSHEKKMKKAIREPLQVPIEENEAYGRGAEIVDSILRGLASNEKLQLTFDQWKLNQDIRKARNHGNSVLIKNAERAAYDNLKRISELSDKIGLQQKYDVTGWEETAVEGAHVIASQAEYLKAIGVGVLVGGGVGALVGSAGGAIGGAIYRGGAGVAAGSSIGAGAGMQGGKWLGARVFGLGQGYRLGAAEIYSDLMDAKDENGMPLDPDVVDVTVMIGGMAMAGVELLELGIELEALGLGGLNRGLSPSAAVKSALANKTTRRALMEMAAAWANHVVGEAFEEAGQEATNFVSSWAARKETAIRRDQKGPLFDIGEMAGGVAQAGETGALAGLIMGGGGAAWKGFHKAGGHLWDASLEQMRWSRATRDMPLVNAIADLVESGVAGENGEASDALEDFIRIETKRLGREADTYYLDPFSLIDKITEENGNPEEVLANLIGEGAADAMMVAVAKSDESSRTTLAVPIKKVFESWKGTPYMELLRQHAAMAEGDISQNQLNAMLEEASLFADAEMEGDSGTYVGAAEAGFIRTLENHLVETQKMDQDMARYSTAQTRFLLRKLAKDNPIAAAEVFNHWSGQIASEAPRPLLASRQLSEMAVKMAPAERGQAVFLDKNSGLYNETGFFSQPARETHPVIARVKFEGTKWKNIEGHTAGNELYRLVGQALHGIPTVDDASKVGGDLGFSAQSDAHAQSVTGPLRKAVRDRMRAANPELAEKIGEIDIIITSAERGADEKSARVAWKAMGDVGAKEAERREGLPVDDDSGQRRALRGEKPLGLPTEKAEDLRLPSERAQPRKLHPSLMERAAKLTSREVFDAAFVNPWTKLLSYDGFFALHDNPDTKRKYVIAMDLNGLRAINDKFGDAEGDRLIKFFADVARIMGGGEMVMAHLSGDEFAAMTDDKELAQYFVDLIGFALENVGDGETKVTFGYGIQEDYDSADADVDPFKRAEEKALAAGRTEGTEAYRRQERASGRWSGSGPSGRGRLARGVRTPVFVRPRKSARERVRSARAATRIEIAIQSLRLRALRASDPREVARALARAERTVETDALAAMAASRVLPSKPPLMWGSVDELWSMIMYSSFPGVGVDASPSKEADSAYLQNLIDRELERQERVRIREAAKARGKKVPELGNYRTQKLPAYPGGMFDEINKELRSRKGGLKKNEGVNSMRHAFDMLMKGVKDWGGVGRVLAMLQRVEGMESVAVPQEVLDHQMEMAYLAEQRRNEIEHYAEQDDEYRRSVEEGEVGDTSFDPDTFHGPEEALAQGNRLRTGEERIERLRDRALTRDIALALAERTREKFGLVERDDRSNESSEKLAQWMVEEILFEMQPENIDGSGVGWYAEKFQRAIDIFGEAHPALKTDKNQRALFTLMVAITSNEATPFDNIRYADDVYSDYEKTGKISARAASRPAVAPAIEKVQEMLDQFNGNIGTLVAHLLEETTQSELTKTINEQRRKEGKAPKSSNFTADTVIPRAAVYFGPKIGMFYSNLMGNANYLTMDRWWSRTFNRYRGKLVKEPTKAGLKKFKNAIGKPRMSDQRAIQASIPYRNKYKAKGFKNGTKLETMANTIYKAAFEQLEDTPFNATDRKFMIDTADRAKHMLSEEHGVDITIADIQATLWYYEKRLYTGLGAQDSGSYSYGDIAEEIVRDRYPASGEALDRGRSDLGGGPVSGLANLPGPDTGVGLGEELDSLLSGDAGLLDRHSGLESVLFQDEEVDDSPVYPMASSDVWYSNADYEARDGKLASSVPPRVYLDMVRWLEIDEVSRENIDDLKEHILSGGELDPLALYEDGAEDGRHRAHAALELGIKHVPVLVFGRQNQLDIIRETKRFQREGDPREDMVVTHNLSAENLEVVSELGAIAAPSIAISRTTEGVLAGFGEVTLVGGPSLIDPSTGMPVFDADVYSPRFPRAEYRYNEKAAKKLKQELKRHSEKLSSVYGWPDIEDQITKKGLDAPVSGSGAMHTALQMEFLEEKGETDVLEVPERGTRYNLGPSELPVMQRMFKRISADTIAEAYRNWDDPEYAKTAKSISNALRKGYIELGKQVDEVELYRDVIEDQFDENGLINSDGIRYKLVRDARKYRDVKGATAEADPHALITNVRELIEEKYEDEYRAWSRERIAPLVGDPYIPKYVDHHMYGPRLRRIPFTMQNILREMTRRIRQMESETAAHGLGGARSLGAKRLRSMKAIIAAREKITSKEEFEAAKAVVAEKFFFLSSKLESYHPAFRGERRFGFLDTLAITIGDSYRRGWGMRRAMRENGFETVPADLVEEAADMATELLALPTEYFEAKAQRAVELSEFEGAVVPSDASERTVQILEDAGLRVETYDRSGEDYGVADRQRAVTQMATEEEVLFQDEEESEKPVFYSAAKRAAQNAKQAKNTPQAWMSVLGKTPGVKKEELEWLGVEEWLNRQGKSVSRDDLVKFIELNEIVIKEEFFGEPKPRDLDKDLAHVEAQFDWIKGRWTGLRGVGLMAIGDAESGQHQLPYGKGTDFDQWRKVREGLDKSVRDTSEKLSAAADAVIKAEADRAERQAAMIARLEEEGRDWTDEEILQNEKEDARVKELQLIRDEAAEMRGKAVSGSAANPTLAVIEEAEGNVRQAEKLAKEASAFAEEALEAFRGGDVWLASEKIGRAVEVESGYLRSLGFENNRGEWARLKSLIDESLTPLPGSTMYENYSLGGHTPGSYREVTFYAPGTPVDRGYESPHFESLTRTDGTRTADQGLLAHARIAEHTTRDGRKVLHIDEVQADPLQAAREAGFERRVTPSDLPFIEAAQRYAQRISMFRDGWVTGPDRPAATDMKTYSVNLYSHPDGIGLIRSMHEVAEKDLGGLIGDDLAKSILAKPADDNVWRPGVPRASRVGYQELTSDELPGEPYERIENLVPSRKDIVKVFYNRDMGLLYGWDGDVDLSVLGAHMEEYSWRTRVVHEGTKGATTQLSEESALSRKVGARTAAMLLSDQATKETHDLMTGTGGRPAEMIGAVAVEADVVDPGERRRSPTSSGQRIPRAPLKATWDEMIAKRMLRYAADKGYDQITWTTGQQQKDRYPTAGEAVSEVRWYPESENFVAYPHGEPNAPRTERAQKSRLPLYLGSALSKKLLESETKEDEQGEYHVLEGDGLEVKTIGQFIQYDQRLPKVFRKLTKKHGGKIGRTNIKVRESQPGDQEAGPRIVETGTTVWHVELPQSVLDMALEGQPLFQDDEDGKEEKDTRGWVRIMRDGARSMFQVFLTEESDYTTTLHELAHVNFEMIGDMAEHPQATEHLREEYGKILKWLGVESRDQLTREHKEKFARGTERFLMEGRSPSAELSGAFSAYRLMFNSVYESVDDLNVELNDEIRGVFNRFLATDKEIARAEAAAGLDNPIWKTAEQAGMTPEEWKAHREKKARASNLTLMLIQRKRAESDLRSAEAFQTAEFARIKEEIQTEWDERLDVRAYRFMRYGESLDNGELVRRRENGKLNQDLVDQVGGEGHPINDVLPKGRIVKKGGRHPGELAEALGFESGAALIDAVANLPDEGAWVQAQAERRMKDAHPEIEGEISRLDKLAKQAMHNELTNEWLLEELKTLGVAKGAATDGAKKTAASLVEKTPVGRLSPNLILKRQQTIAAKAVEVLAKNDRRRVIHLKLQGLLSHHMYRETTAAVKDREKFLKKAKTLTRDKARARLGKGNPVFRDVIDTLMENMGLTGREGPNLGSQRVFSVSPGGDATQARKQDVQRAGLGELVLAYERPGLEATMGFDLELVGSLLGGPRSWKDLSVAEMREVYKAIRSIERVASKSRTTRVGDRRMEKEEVIERVKKEAKESPLIKEKPPLESTEVGMSMLKYGVRVASDFDGMLLKPETMVDWLGATTIKDPINVDSTIHQAITVPMQESKARNADLIEEHVRPIVDAFEHVPIKLRDQMLTVIDGAALFPNHTKKLKPPKHMFELVMMALHRGTTSSIERLTEGRNITLEEVDNALGLLPRELLVWAQAVTNAAESFWPLSRDLEERTVGLAPPKLEAVPYTITLRDGTTVDMDGGYFPAAYDPRVERIGEKQSVEQVLSPAHNRPGTHKSHLKHRSESFSGVLSFDPAVITTHLFQVAHDIAYRENLQSVANLVFDDRMQEVLKNYLGEGLSRVFKQWLIDIGQGGRGQNDAHAGKFGQFTRMIRANSAWGILGYRVDLVAADTTALPRAVTATGLKSSHLAAALKEWIENSEGLRAMALELSGTVRERDQAVREDFEKIVRNLTASQKWPARAMRWYKDHAFAPAMYIDRKLSTIIWYAGYRQGISEGMTKDKAIQYGESILRRTQPSFNVVDKAAIQRSKGFIGYVTTFYGFLSTLHQIQRSNIQPVLAAKDKEALAAGLSKAMVTAISLGLIEHMLAELIIGRGPEPGEDWWKWALRRNLIGQLMTVPRLGGLAESIVADRAPSMRTDPLTGTMDNIYRSFNRATKEGGDPMDAALQTAKAAAIMGGVPTYPLKGGRFWYDVATGRTSTPGPFGAASGTIYGKWRHKEMPLNPFTMTEKAVEALTK